MTDTPSKAALDKAVKPANYKSWTQFANAAPKQVGSGIVDIALAYAEFLDKADKVGRYHVSGGHECWEGIDALAQALILPDPIDPKRIQDALDLLEAREIVKETLDPRSHSRCDCRDKIDAGEWDNGPKVRGAMAGLRRGRELARDTDAMGHGGPVSVF